MQNDHRIPCSRRCQSAIPSTVSVNKASIYHTHFTLNRGYVWQLRITILMSPKWRAKSLPGLQEPDPTRVLPDLPEELWYEIIKHASVILGVAEFSTKPEQFTGIYTGEDTAIMNREPLRIALGYRLKMVFVCRSWATIALPILWSHLRIPFTGLSSLLETMRLKPQLGLCVQRISTMEQHLRLSMMFKDFDEDTLLRDIVQLCPNLITVQLPVFNDQTLPEGLRNLNLLWHFSRSYFPLLPQSLTSLTMEFVHQPQAVNPFLPLQLPSLQALNIRQLSLYEACVNGIVQGWDLPSLRVLVLPGGSAQRVVTILKKFAPTLNMVKIFSHLSLDGWSGEPLPMEKLSRLDIISSRNTVECLKQTLRLPNLRTLLVFWPYYRDIPFFDTEKVYNVDIFCQFLGVIHAWCPSPTVIAFESGDYVEWLVRQRAVVNVFAGLRNEGRVVLPEAGLQPLDLS
jgi:hypothetical protein